MICMEYYYSAMKNDILLFAATWKDYKGIILSKKSQTEKQSSMVVARG